MKNQLGIRTSTKYRYRFVCRPRLEKQQSTTSKNASRAEKLVTNHNSAIHAHSEPLENRHRKTAEQASASAESRPLMGTAAGDMKICGHCRNKEARYSSQGSIPTSPIPHRWEAMKGRRSRNIFKRQATTSEPVLSSDLRPDDLPQTDGYCCGHAYLKLSDLNRCVCLCVQCRDLNCDEGNVKRSERSGFRRSLTVKQKKNGGNEKENEEMSATGSMRGCEPNTISTTAGTASCGPLENKVLQYLLRRWGLVRKLSRLLRSCLSISTC